MAEGKLHHLFYGVIDRELSGYYLTPKHFYEVLPSGLEIVALSNNGNREQEYIKKHLPEFSRQTQIGELSGWIVYTKGELISPP